MPSRLIQQKPHAQETEVASRKNMRCVRIEMIFGTIAASNKILRSFVNFVTRALMN